jgi:predicted amidohydrolase YtcJ
MDPARPGAQALAIRDGRILALGQDGDIRALARPSARVIAAGERLALPGLIDALVHLMDGGRGPALSAQLGAARTPAEFLRLTAVHAATAPGPLVTGERWEPGIFGDHNLTRDLIERAVTDRPCMLWDTSFHMACVNTAAIAMAGLTGATPDPPNFHFVRYAAGRPTGMLHEAAVARICARLPPPGPADDIAGVRAGQAHANRHGITGIVDPHVRSRHVAAYDALAAEDALTLRLSGAAGVSPRDTADTMLARLTALRAAHRGLFQLNAAKVCLDGELENRTAAMITPYADAPDGNAPLMFPTGHIAELFAALDAARFQIHDRAIGDLAASAALDGFAAARAANGAWPWLHQIAQLQVIHTDCLPRIAALGVMANVQPLWAQIHPAMPDPALPMIGPARLPFTYAFRWMRDVGAPLCLSSDFAVSTPNPFEIIATALTRAPRGGTAPAFLPGERFTLAEALDGYTTQAAAAA